MAADQWWRDILSGIHAPDSAVNRSNLNAWVACEGGSAAYNPFNTTEPWPRATDYNSVGVKNYASYQDGVSATIATLENGFYPNILAALRSSARRSVFAGAVGASPWGTSGACIGGASGVTPPSGSPPGPPGIIKGTKVVRRATREVAQSARLLVWQRMQWDFMGRRGWPR